MSNDRSNDEFLEAEIERALAPCRAEGYSEETLEEMARLLRTGLTEEPTGRYLLRRARPRIVDQSGDVSLSNANGARKARSAR